MRSAPCAWAPSHTLHAMPSRITRNSHRPRASDRTMVDLEHQFGLPLFRTRWHRHHPRRKLMSMGNRPSFSREAQLQWAGSRETNLASGRGRTFFLTSLFIELIDPPEGAGGVLGVMAMLRQVQNANIARVSHGLDWKWRWSSIGSTGSVRT
jgi:hypothetical protein